MNDRLKLLVQESKEKNVNWDDRINKYILAVNDLYTLVTDAFLSVDEEKLVHIQSRQVSLADKCGTYHINELYVDMGKYRFIFRPLGFSNYGNISIGVNYVMHDGTTSPTFNLLYNEKDCKWMSGNYRPTTKRNPFGEIVYENFAITSPNDLADYFQTFIPQKPVKNKYLDNPQTGGGMAIGDVMIQPMGFENTGVAIDHWLPNYNGTNG